MATVSQFLLSQPRFKLNPLESPTHFNLHKHLQAAGWRSTRFNWLADFANKNLLFNLHAAQQLEFKHLLAELVAEYCPQIMPETYCINDHNWPAILSQIADTYYMKDHQLQDSADDVIWILKPALLNNGLNIKIFKNLSDIEQHFISPRRLGGEHVLQRYITQPHLLKNHKYSIRMFVIATNYAGSYLYQDGYFNVALTPYQSDDFTYLNAHLTNEHLTEEAANVVQIPSRRMDVFPMLSPQINTLVATAMKALREKHPQAFMEKVPRTMAIFGFDFMVDSNLRVWLLEANHGPCFPIEDDHPLQKYLYVDFWQALITSFILPNFRLGKDKPDLKKNEFIEIV